MADKYGSMTELLQNERHLLDFHFEISYRKGSPVISKAVHGGAIEAGTSELARELARMGNYSYYLFEGVKASNNFVDLHVTSTNFDEPHALKIVGQALTSISFHGMNGTAENTVIGGLDRTLRQKVSDHLQAAGFNTEIVPDSHHLSGTNTRNITNKTKTGRGVQLEITAAQRNLFFETNTRPQRRYTQTDLFYRYVRAVYEAINDTD